MQGQSLDDVPTDVIVDAAQLVKSNSIQGNKLDNISVVYTMWENLKKTNSMEVGQVAFHDDNKVRYYQVEKRRNDIVNRLNKTKTERFPDFREEREKRDAAQREMEKAERRRQNELEKERQKQRQKEEELKSYRSLLQSEKMTSNYDNGNDSDEFMWTESICCKKDEKKETFYNYWRITLDYITWINCSTSFLINILIKSVVVWSSFRWVKTKDICVDKIRDRMW